MDLYKYDRALHSNLLISQESYDLMTQESSKVGTKSYGYGWYVNTGVEDTPWKFNWLAFDVTPSSRR